METVEPVKAPVRIPFVCPICSGQNAIELIVLSRAGGTDCVECGKHLRSADVMRAMHSPRVAGSQRLAARASPAKKPAMVWPPTKESRAAISPMRERRDGSMN